MNLRTSLSVAYLALAAACSTSSSSSPVRPSDGGAGDGGGATPMAKAAGDAANAYCARVQACAPALFAIGYGDTATCVTTFAGDLARALAAPGVTETAAQVEACATAFAQVSCGDLLGRKPVDACKPSAGTLADGAACGADGQCAGARCKVALGQVCGTCTTRAGAGAACGVDDDCGDGMLCLVGKCAAYGVERATCDATHPCRPDLSCTGGACGAPGAAGAACTGNEQCGSAAGVVCNPQSKKCDTLVYGSAGAPCGFVGGKVATCTGGSACVQIQTPSYVGKCAALAVPGAACDTANGPVCGSGAVCVCASNVDGGCAGTCRTRDPAACH